MKITDRTGTENRKKLLHALAWSSFFRRVLLRVIMLLRNHGTDTGICEDFQQNTVWYPPVNNMDAFNTVVRRQCSHALWESYRH